MTDGMQAPSTAMAIAYSAAAKAADAVLDAVDFLSGIKEKDKVTPQYHAQIRAIALDDQGL